MNDDTPIKLAATVHVVRRQSGLLLHCRRTGQTLRLSAAAAALLPPLTQGSSVAGLVQTMSAAFPNATGLSQKVQGFLAPLGSRRRTLRPRNSFTRSLTESSHPGTRRPSSLDRYSLGATPPRTTGKSSPNE